MCVRKADASGQGSCCQRNRADSDRRYVSRGSAKKKNEKNFVSIPVRNCVHNRVENLRVVMLLQVRPTYQLLCPHLHSHVFYLFFHDVMCDIRKSTGDHYYY